MQISNATKPAKRRYHKKSWKKRLTKARPKKIGPPRIPKEYIWDVLRALGQDLAPYLSSEKRDLFAEVVRKKDYQAYIRLCKKVSLQNIEYGTELSEIRAIRMMTIAEKFRFTDTEDALVLAAIEKFLGGEEECRRTNSRGVLNNLPSDEYFFTDVLSHAQHFCKIVLGDFDEIGILRGCRFGPGADVGTVQGRVSMFDKLANPPYTVTSAALHLAKRRIYSDARWLRSLLADFFDNNDVMNWGYSSYYYERPLYFLTKMLSCPLMEELWNHFVFDVVEHNVINTVPKSAQTDRDMAKEPRLNIMLQLGVDTVIRKNLKRFGIDIDDQTKNQILAKWGSEFGHLATLDLSNASNLISSLAVKTLLAKADPDWLEVLDDLRSPFGQLRFPKLGIDEQIRYQKISSMGNGFTFALETLLFSSIVYGVIRDQGLNWPDLIDDVAIYGDDIIVPKDLARDVIYCLHRCGFKVNSKKSFLEGPIRESCGKDYYLGKNIRPPHLSDAPKELPALMVDRNRIFLSFVEYFNVEPTNVVQLFEKWIPENLRYHGPINEDLCGWLFTLNKPMPRFDKDLQAVYWVLPYLRFKRKALPLPRTKRVRWQRMLHTTRLRPIFKDKLYFLEEDGSSFSVFDVLGRNCPLHVFADRRLLTKWPE